MMTGIVTANREAVLSLKVQDVNGVMQEIETVVDTGYNGFLTLPADFVAALGLIAYGQRLVTLGDGQDVLLQVYEATVVWDDAPRLVQVLATDGDAVLGMSLLYGYRVIMDVVDGGLVTIEARP
jgi:clan AA aspartic protease